MVSPEAKKQLEELSKDQRQRIIKTIKQLEHDPIKKRPKVDIKKLIGIKGKPDLFRLRVGNYRIIYEVSEETVWISEIVKRGKAYKFLL